MVVQPVTQRFLHMVMMLTEQYVDPVTREPFNADALLSKLLELDELSTRIGVAYDSLYLWLGKLKGLIPPENDPRCVLYKISTLCLSTAVQQRQWFIQSGDW